MTDPKSIQANSPELAALLSNHPEMGRALASLPNLVGHLDDDAAECAALDQDLKLLKRAGPAATLASIQGQCRTELGQRLAVARISDFPAARVEGAQAERARIQGVLRQNFPGHEALIERLAFDGKTTPHEAAALILEAERAMHLQMHVDWSADAPQPVPASIAGDDSGADAPAGRLHEARTYAQSNGLSFLDAIKALGIRR